MHFGHRLWMLTMEYAACCTTPDKGMPEEGIIARMTAQEEGWLVQKLNFSLINDVRRDGHVFNFKDQDKTTTNFRDENVRILYRLV